MKPAFPDNLLLLVFITMLMLMLLVFSILIVLRYRRRREFHELEKQRLRFEASENLLSAKLEIQEETFQSISREIHDNIGQVLSLAKLNLNTLDPERPAEALGKVNEAKDLLTGAIQDLRDLSRTLHTHWITEVGWVRAIDTEGERLRKLGMRVNMDAIEGAAALPAAAQLLLFRMGQEILQNVIKHAGATEVNIGISVTAMRNRLSIADDGKGFDTATVSAGSGLRNLKERARILGAELEVVSAPGNGTTIIITVPQTNFSWQP